MLQIWKTQLHKSGLRKTIDDLPALVFSTKEVFHLLREVQMGVLVNAEQGGNDSLAGIDHNGNSVTEVSSRSYVRRIKPDTPAIPRREPSRVGSSGVFSN